MPETSSQFDREKAAINLFDQLFETKKGEYILVNAELNAWTLIDHSDVAAIRQEDYPSFADFWQSHNDAYWSPRKALEPETELDLLQQCIALFSEAIAFTETEIQAYQATTGEQSWEDFKLIKHLRESVLIPMLERQHRCQRHLEELKLSN